METIAFALYGVGFVMSAFGFIALLVEALRRSWMWGCLLFVPVVGAITALVFVLKYPGKAGYWYLLMLLGGVIMLLASRIGGPAY